MENQITVNFPVPPEAVMPEPLQTIFLWVTFVASVGVLLWAASLGKRHGTFAPVLMVAGGFVAILMEPLVTFLGHVIHPEEDQIMMFKTATRAIPWHIALGYTAVFGIVYMTLFRRIASGNFDSRFIWKTILTTAVCEYLFESIPVSNGLWVYYDHQPLWIWKGSAPIVWCILNASCILMSFTVMFIGMQRLKGVAQLLTVPLGAMGAAMGHFGAGLPFYNAINSDLPIWVIQLSGVASVGLAFVVIWLCTVLLTSLTPASVTQAASPTATVSFRAASITVMRKDG